MEKVDDKRSAILATTLDLIAENGFHGTAMSKIAKQAGVSAGIIYHYFDGKDALIHALYQDIKSQLGAALMQVFRDDTSFAEAMIAIWLGAYQYCITHPKQIVFLEQFENSPYYDAEIVAAMVQDENFAKLTTVLQNHGDQIKDLPQMAIYEMTIGVAIGIAKRQVAGLIQLDDVTLRQIAESCYHAISKH